jgi:hypothetical protein
MEEIGRRARLHYSPRVHHRDVLAKFAYDSQIVTDEDDR